MHKAAALTALSKSNISTAGAAALTGACCGIAQSDPYRRFVMQKNTNVSLCETSVVSLML